MSQVGKAALSYSFLGKRVLVTGGGMGLGRTLVQKLYEDGAQVFTLERDLPLVEKLRKDFPKIRAENVDISNWAETQRVIDSFGPMDHLVNSAGVIKFEGFLKVNEESYSKQVDVNLKGVVCTTQAVARGMIEKGTGGTIVSVTSIGIHVHGPGSTVYCASKAAVLDLTKGLAFELGKHNIRVNCVSPACIDTPMFNANVGELPDDSFVHRQPLAGRWLIKPEEVADSILFLLSPLSSLTTGTEILIDGGVATC